MIERNERPMTENERETVRIFTDGWARSSMPILTIVGALLMGLATIVMFIGVANSNGRAAVGLLRWAVIGLLLTGGLVVKLYLSLKRRVGYSQDLERSVAEVLRITVEGQVAKVVVPVAHDAPNVAPLWLVEIGDNQVMVLRGDYIKPLEDDRLFPSTVFEIVRAKASGLELSTRTLGEYRTVDRIASAQFQPMATDGEIRIGTMAQILDQFRAV
jgi:hypothetical protein